MIFSRKCYVIYSQPTIVLPSVRRSSPDLVFEVDSPRALAKLKEPDGVSGIDLGDPKSSETRRRLGDINISGWIGDNLVFCGWLQFGNRRVTAKATFPISYDEAFICRCETHSDFRGLCIFPEAIDFCCQWLGDKGFHRAMIDHDENNFSSRNAILKTGMEPIGKFVLTRRFWIHKLSILI